MENGNSAGSVYNVGSAEEITIEELADRIIKMADSKSEKKYISYEEAYGKPFDDMTRRVPSLNRIKETVGYEARTSLEEILQAVIEEGRSRLKK